MTPATIAPTPSPRRTVSITLCSRESPNWHAIVHAAGQPNDLVEAELEAQGLMRRVRVRIEHYLAVPTILSQSDVANRPAFEEASVAG